MMVPVALFANVYGLTVLRADMSVDDLHNMACSETASTKEALRLFSYGTYGNKLSAQNSYRWNDNVGQRTGWIGDIDNSGGVTLAEVEARCNERGLACFGYTTPSHTPQAPRLRVGGPFATPIPAHEWATKGLRYMARINGLLGDILAPESVVLSQGFFIGKVDGVTFESFVGEGDACLDELDELDSIAISVGSPKPNPKPKGTKPDYHQLSRDELEQLIIDGQHFYGPGKEILKRDAYAEVPQQAAEDALRKVFDKTPAALQTRDWTKGSASIGRWATHIYAGIARRKGQFFRKLVDHLSEAEEWRGAIRFNRFAQVIEVSDPFPPVAGQVSGSYRPLSDPLDILEAMMVLQEQGFPTVTKTNVTDAVVVVAEHRSFHPVQDDLRALPPWDGVARVSRFFIDYIPGTLPPEGHPDRDDLVAYHEKVGECFLVGAVARALRPGCKVDTLPCLIALQGWNKSKALATLVPNSAWFSDELSADISSRDAKESLSGKWIIECSEFPQARRDIDHFKAFFSRSVDRYRKAYGRLSADYPRGCVFIASANALAFIDVTGNRRVWPVELEKPIDEAAIEHDRDQIWAEALHVFDDGFQWWLPPSIEAIAGQMQDAFIEPDEWDGLVLAFLDVQFPEKQDGTRDKFTRRDVIEGLRFDYSDPGNSKFPKPADENRVERRLRALGFTPEPHRRKQNGKRFRFWIVARP